MSPYSEDFGGAVLNATIDRHAFAFIESSPDWKIRFVASDLGFEEVFPLDLDAVHSTRLPLHAAVYRRMVSEFGGGCPLAITLQSMVDAPAGSGLGSSSALVVALVEAFRCALDVPLGPYDVAQLAFEIERIDLGFQGGKQDHYAAAFGGINFIEFLQNDKVIVNPLRVSRSFFNEIEASLVTCFSGISRRSAEIIENQQKGMIDKKPKTVDSLHSLKLDSHEMKAALLGSDIVRMGDVLQRSWKAKKETADAVSTPEIESLIDAALDAGAIAGKVSGAGGGGFIMFIVPPERRLKVIHALNKAGAIAEGAQLTMDGVESWMSQK
ncbi:GHMP family kinase ATP-binding protein [Bradyrhizobium sp. USDA 4486]